MIDIARLAAFSAKPTETPERKRIVPGNYVVKIMRVQIQYASWDNKTEIMHIDYDIAEGEYANYWRDDYSSRSARKPAEWAGYIDIKIYDGAFARFVNAVEASNDGFDFQGDEQTLVGKLCGFRFRREEYIAKDTSDVKSVVKPYKYSFISASDARANKLPVLEDYTIAIQERFKAKRNPQPPMPQQTVQRPAMYVPQQYQQPKAAPKFETVTNSDEELPF